MLMVESSVMVTTGFYQRKMLAMSAKDYLGLGLLVVMPAALLNHAAFSETCEARELACRAYPDHPHSPEELPMHVLNTGTATLTSSTAAPPQVLSVPPVMYGPVMPNGALTLTTLPISTGTMVNGDYWS
jgi:hypothetical protein